MKNKLKKILSPSFWIFNKEKYLEYIKADEEFNASFRGDGFKLSKGSKKAYSYENKAVILYRKYQANIGNVWRFSKKYIFKKCVRLLYTPYFSKGKKLTIV